MTGKRHVAERSLSLLQAGGVANRVMATSTGASMAMQQASGGMLAAGIAVRTASRIVAASNASTLMKAMADAVCDGTADEVEINAALTALGWLGGRVLLSEGTFTLAAPIIMNADKQTLAGMGLGATTLAAKNAAGTPLDVAIIQISGAIAELRDLTVDGNKANNATLTHMMLVSMASLSGSAYVQRVRLINSAGTGMMVANTVQSAVVRDCLIESNANGGMICRSAYACTLVVSGCTAKNNSQYGFLCDNGSVILSDCQALSSGAYGFDVATDAAVIVQNCHAQGNTCGFRAGAASVLAQFQDCRAISNTTLGFLSDTGATRPMFIGCTAQGTGTGTGFASNGNDDLIVGCHSASHANGFSHNSTGRMQAVGCQSIANTDRIFDVTNGQAQIQGCYGVSSAASSGYAIVMQTAGSNHMVDGCRIRSWGADGILCVVPNVQITNNYTSDVGLAMNGTYRHIVTGGNRSFIHGNVMRDPGSGNRPAYGIYVTSDSTNSYVGVNEIAGTGTVSSFLDQGVNTRQTVKQQLLYNQAIDSAAGALTANTWTNIHNPVSFRVDSPTSVVEITVRGCALVGIGGSHLNSRLAVDAAATPIYRNLGGDMAQGNGYSNVLAGGGQCVRYTGLAVGTHTVSVQARCQTSVSLYCRSASYPNNEMLVVQAMEYQR